MKEKLKAIILNNSGPVGAALKLANGVNPKNRAKVGKGNTVTKGAALLNGCSIVIEGTGNTVEIGDFTKLANSSIYIRGNNNHLCIGERCNFNGTEFCIEDDGNEMLIGNNTTVQGRTQLAAIEGTRLEIGEDCMFSQDIYVRTGDSHSVIDAKTGERTNRSKDVTIGRHCWIGMNATVLKGAVIEDNSVVAASAVVSKAFDEGGCVIAGIPGEIVKRGIDWRRERI